MSDRSKITEEHRRRRAVVYVRQSTPTQLERNHESRARQYALRERAIELGWPSGSVSVVDDDLGRSGASADGRLGFKELVAEVGLGRVGLVLALETSRLARSSADWHRLLDLCALTSTLIADQDGIYSPADFNDRLLLGLKGTMSEAELHLIRARLEGGLRNKAKRGELEQNLPVGLDRDEEGRVALSSDEQVRHAIGRVFELWRRVGSARQVVACLREEGQRLPRRSVGSRRLRWTQASYGAVHDFLTNPAYAGAFVFGRTSQKKTLDGEGRVRRRTVELPLEQWSVCLPEHHPGYVSWDEYLATRERLRLEPTAGGLGTPGSPNLVGGFSANSVDTGLGGSVIAGGSTLLRANRIQNNYDFIGAGFGNSAGSAAGNMATAIGAGTNNNAPAGWSFIGAGDSNRATADYDFVGAGADNHAGSASGGEAAAVVAGTGNAANGGYALIGAGTNNLATADYSAIGAGQSNIASGRSSVVAGGVGNIASGFDSAVPGGFGNTAGGGDSTVAGGLNSTASGFGSAVAGGELNTASGVESTIAGGAGNTASGDLSFAAGTQALATQNGSFVWGDNTFANVTSPAANTSPCAPRAGSGWGRPRLPRSRPGISSTPRPAPT